MIFTSSQYKHLYLAILLVISCSIIFSCGKKQDNPAPVQKSAPTQQAAPPLQTGLSTGPAGDTSKANLNAMPPRSDSYYVLDSRTNTIFGIDLNTNTISSRYLRSDNVVAIQYDAGHNWIYEAIGNPTPGLDVYDAGGHKYVQKFRFPGAPSALLYHPLQRRLYLVSADSTNFRYFDPDSMKIVLSIGLHIQDRAPISPTTINPGPLGKLITANAAHPSVSSILTDNGFMLQTVIIHNAQHIDNAVFSFDGNSTFCCDTQQGALFRVEFGTGKVLAEKYQLKRPRMVQIEVMSNTVVFVEGNNELVMLNPDTFRETGRVSLAEYGDEILSFLIPPRANFAEVLLDYKGVTRWMRFDIQNWKPTRFVELI